MSLVLKNSRTDFPQTRKLEIRLPRSGSLEAGKIQSHVSYQTTRIYGGWAKRSVQTEPNQ
jgi:hypothetical protein